MTQSTPSNETCPAELPNFCAQRHWSIFWILIICSVAVVSGRIMTIRNYNAAGDPPFFSANDRSRWSTIRALGDDGTYVIDQVIHAKEKIGWNTIDKVRHVGHDGKFHYYSSKPTLLPTMLAGGYRVLHQFTGWTLGDDTHAVVKTLLIILNGGGWFVFLFFMAKTINAIPVRDWSRYYVLACAGFGTFLSTFANTLNNHLPAAVSVMVSLYLLSTIWRRKENHWLWFAGCGLFAAFAAANELPALSFFAMAGFFCLLKSPVKTLLAFTPAAAIIAAGLFGTNYLAHQTWKPAYAHRSDGNEIASVTGNFAADLDANRLPQQIKAAVETQFEMSNPQVEADGWPSTPTHEVKRWVVRDRIGQNQVGTNQFVIRYQYPAGDSPSATPNFEGTYQILSWNNWYDYPNSYWSKLNDNRKSDVDKGQTSRMTYAFHVLFGHHGIFSLTPIWIISLAGMIALLSGVKIAGRFQMRWLGLLGLVLSFVVVAFYLRRPEMDRNYGGVTSGLRWVFWLAPIWLVSMLPVVDWLAKSKAGKFACYALLFVSILSASYSVNNPWVNPWLYELWDATGIAK